MLLSGEINKVEMKLTTYWNARIIILIAFLGVAAAALFARSPSEATLVEDNISKILAWALIICGIVIGIIYKTCYLSPYQKGLKPLINIREEIISSGELTDFREIGTKWKGYIKNYYRNLLDKPEMDKEKKNWKGGKR